jgi:formamidopyrimidine-DNA glycosylase
MPELPEVETVVRGLCPILVGHTISDIHLFAPKTSIVISPSLAPATLRSALAGRTVEAITRRGKNILISVSGNLTLWVHLKMTGRFHWVEHSVPRDRHDLVVMTLDTDASRELRFHDYRRFGRFRLFRDWELNGQKGLGDLGPEPLEMSGDDFVKLCRARSRMIKPALLDQTFLAGLGNIYADEALYAARIHPKRLTNSLSRTKLIELHRHIQRLLRKAIRLMGTSVDTYAGVNGKPGSFQKYLKAYAHEGEPCERCGHAIVRKKIGSRSAHYCPHCQRR